MRFAMGFWVSLASSSALLDSGSVAGSAAFPALIVTLSKTAKKRHETGGIQEAFIDSFFIVVLFFFADANPRFRTVYGYSAFCQRSRPLELPSPGSAGGNLLLEVKVLHNARNRSSLRMITAKCQPL